MPIAQSVSDLGVGDYDGQVKVLEYGPSGQEERFSFEWRADFTPDPAWVTKTATTITMRDGWHMDAEGSPFGGFWGYIYKPYGAPGQFGQSSYSWDPRAISHADAAFAAGLKLQEKILMRAWVWIPTDIWQIGTIWFPMNQGDVFSNVNDPVPHVGCVATAAQGLQRFTTTGWVDSQKQSCTKRDLCPMLYSHRNPTPLSDSRDFLDYLVAWRRWVAVPA